MQIIRSLLLNIFVSAVVSGGVALTLVKMHPLSGNVDKPNPENHATKSTHFVRPSDEQIKKNLQALVAVPGEEKIRGKTAALSDRSIGNISSAAAKDFIAQANEVLSKDANPSPDLCFALGRIALLHNQLSIGRLYLNKAAVKDYGAAYAYLADKNLARSPFEQWQNYSKAIQLRFLPARDWRNGLEKKIISTIERFAGDPQDPDLPQGQYGISTARLIGLDDAVIDALIQDYGFYVKLKGARPYLVYSLGRAAYLHQRFHAARDYLGLAAENGSAAAAAYLAYPDLTSDLNQRVLLLRKASQGNYIPAQRALKDALELRQRIPASR